MNIHEPAQRIAPMRDLMPIVALIAALAAMFWMQRMTPMYDMDGELKIRRGGKTARPIALTMRAVPFEAMWWL